MLHAIAYHTQPTIIGTFIVGVPAFFDSVAGVINRLGVSILLVALSISLFYLHHNLFALGFVIGFIFDKQVRAIAEKVHLVYNAQRTLLGKVALFGGGGFLALLTMPTSIVIATLYYSAHWGALLYRNSCARQPPVEPTTSVLGEAIHQGANAVEEAINQGAEVVRSLSHQEQQENAMGG